MLLPQPTYERLLQALAPWAAEEVERQRQRAEQIRQSTADLSGQERLLQRVVHLRQLVAWAQVVVDRAEFAAAGSSSTTTRQISRRSSHGANAGLCPGAA